MEANEPPPHSRQGVAANFEGEHEVLVEGMTRLRVVHLGQAPRVRAAGRHHDVVDQFGERLKEAAKRIRVGGIEGSTAHGAKLSGGVLEPASIAAGHNDIGALDAGSTPHFKPDAGGATDDDDCLRQQFRLASRWWRAHRLSALSWP
jgi:hypothetical protein